MSNENSERLGSIAAQVGDFYERHPYPPPVEGLDAYQMSWDDSRRHAESHLFWPAQAYREDRSILIAGCGTSQAARYAVRWPRAQVVGIDMSATAIAHSAELKRRHKLDNLELHQLTVERAPELRMTFDYVVCTGVLHHLPDPDAGLSALRAVLKDDGAMHVMVYAPYGRAGVYMLQDYCRRVGIRSTPAELADLVAMLKELPADHPIVPLLRHSPDFTTSAGLADVLLHPQDRSYSVPQLMSFLRRAGLTFGRWVRQAQYLPSCGALRSTPHATRLNRLTSEEQYAAVELFRGTMVRHSAVAYVTNNAALSVRPDFESTSWLEYIPIRLPGTIAVHKKLPAGASAVLINRDHTFTDLYLPITAKQERVVTAIDGKQRIMDIMSGSENQDFLRSLFQELWQCDQVVFDTSTP